MPQDAKTTYDWVVDVDAPMKFILQTGPVPGFKSYKLLDGGWKHEGARRRATLSDGSTATETIKTIKRPEYFDYGLDDFKDSPIAKYLLKRAYGQWWFTANPGGGTHVKWRYSFEPHSSLGVPFLWLFTKLVYRSYMNAAVKRMKHFSRTERLKLE